MLKKNFETISLQDRKCLRVFLFCDAPQVITEFFQHKYYKTFKEIWERKSRRDRFSHCQTVWPVLLCEAALGMCCCSSAAPGTSSDTEGDLSLPWPTWGVFSLLPQIFLLSCQCATEEFPESSYKSSSASALHHHTPHQYPDRRSPIVEEPETPMMKI